MAASIVLHRNDAMRFGHSHVRSTSSLVCLAALLALGHLASAQGLPRARPEDVGLSSAALQQIVPSLRPWLDSGRVPGVIIAVARHGKLAYVDTAGFMDIEHHVPMRTDAVFRIYSMTKPITTVAIMQLMERGKLHLDDPVSKYIPAFANTRVYTGGGVAHPTLEAPAHPVTIATLLTHTAGLTYGVFGSTPVDSMYLRANLLRADEKLAQFADTVASLPLLFTPGSRWTYSMAMDVLGRVVEVVSRKTLDRYFADEIFAPLGMRSTAFHATPEMKRHVAVLYTPTRAGLKPAAPQLLTPEYEVEGKMFFGGSGLLSTVGDYLRFSQMLLNGGALGGHRVLARKTVALMMQNHLGNLYPKGIWPLGRYGFGYGGAVRIDSAATVPGNVGTFRWSGYASTYFWVDPKADLIAMIWTQLAPSNTTFALDNEFQPLVYAAVVRNTARR